VPKISIKAQPTNVTRLNTAKVTNHHLQLTFQTPKNQFIAIPSFNNNIFLNMNNLPEFLGLDTDYVDINRVLFATQQWYDTHESNSPSRPNKPTLTFRPTSDDVYRYADQLKEWEEQNKIYLDLLKEHRIIASKFLHSVSKFIQNESGINRLCISDKTKLKLYEYIIQDLEWNFQLWYDKCTEFVDCFSDDEFEPFVSQ
jgi:hypothetical protein